MPIPASRPHFKRCTLLKPQFPCLESRTDACALAQLLEYCIDILELVPLSPHERMTIWVLKSGMNRPAS